MGPGPIVQHAGGQDGSWLFLFPFSRVRFLLFFLTGGWGPDYDRQGRSGAMETVIYKTATADCFGSGGAAAMALRAACSGIPNTRSHTQNNALYHRILHSQVLRKDSQTHCIQLHIMDLVYARLLRRLRSTQHSVV